MYGPSKSWTDALRRFEDGLLAAINDSYDGTGDDPGYFPATNQIRLPYANPPPPRDHYLKPINRFYSKYTRDVISCAAEEDFAFNITHTR